jgi:hypothetical protein
VSMGLSSSPPRRQAVRGAMILSKEVRTVEVCGRNPRVLVVPVPFPANEVLWFAPETPVAKNLLDFILDMTVRELDGGWCRGAAGERRIGCVGTQKPGMESVVYTAGKKGLGEIQTECNIVDTPRDGKWATELGH